eukprot:gene17612-24469_t
MVRNKTTRLHIIIINPGGDRAAFHINDNNNNSSSNNNNENNDKGNGSDDNRDEKKSSSNNKNKKVSNNNYKNNYPCLMCGENGHKTHQCPELEERQRLLKSYNKKKNKNNKEDDDAIIVQRRINLATAIINPVFQDKNTPLFKNSEVLLDTLSNASIFKDKRMITNLRDIKEPIIISGVGGQQLTVTQEGEAGVFGTVYFHPDTIANLTSYSLLEKNLGAKITRNHDLDSFFDVTFMNEYTSKTFIFKS